MLEKHTADVEKLLRSVKGLVGYTLVRSSDGGFSVTVCEDEAGIDESIQKAKRWIANNADSAEVVEAQITEGTVILHLR
jgi:restriction endonuclease Mrr